MADKGTQKIEIEHDDSVWRVPCGVLYTLASAAKRGCPHCGSSAFAVQDVQNGDFEVACRGCFRGLPAIARPKDKD